MYACMPESSRWMALGTTGNGLVTPLPTVSLQEKLDETLANREAKVKEIERKAAEAEKKKKSEVAPEPVAEGAEDIFSDDESIFSGWFGWKL